MFRSKLGSEFGSAFTQGTASHDRIHWGYHEADVQKKTRIGLSFACDVFLITSHPTFNNLMNLARGVFGAFFLPHHLGSFGHCSQDYSG